MSTKKVNGITNEEASVDVQKRAFMQKFGKYAAAGAGMAVLMTPTSSSAGNYNGHGGTPDQNSVHTDTINHGGSNDRDINGH